VGNWPSCMRFYVFDYMTISTSISTAKSYLRVVTKNRRESTSSLADWATRRRVHFQDLAEQPALGRVCKMDQAAKVKKASENGNWVPRSRGTRE